MSTIQETTNDRTGAEELRLIVSNMNTTSETFNDRYTLEQLVQIGRMLLASEWDIYPDQWTDRQVREALKGIPPQWDKATEKPIYQRKPRPSKATTGARARKQAVKP